MKNLTRPSIALLEGLDGSGKSTTAQAVAQNISENRPEARIAVADSTGLYLYHCGRLLVHQYGGLLDLEPHSNQGRTSTLAHLGAFALGRKLVDYQGMKRSDLLISVRDPHRVEPASYSAVYSPLLGKLSTGQRLTVFDAITRAPYAAAIIRLDVPLAAARTHIDTNETGFDPHETTEKLAFMAGELPRVIDVYRQRFGAVVTELEGLQPTTADMATAAVEPLLGQSRVLVAVNYPSAA